jgi:hypothetical protein
MTSWIVTVVEVDACSSLVNVNDFISGLEDYTFSSESVLRRESLLGAVGCVGWSPVRYCHCDLGKSASQIVSNLSS